MIAFAEKKRIRYWRQGDRDIDHNFGDLLSELVAKDIVLGPKDEAFGYRVIGSCIADWMILDDLRDCADPSARLAFWGCGMRDNVPLDPALQARCIFKSVRGPLTRRALGLPEDTILGDLGLLVPLLHEPSLSRRTAGKAICVPHINDERSDWEILTASMADVVVRPNLEASEAALRRMIDDIASAAFVLGGALHAVIAAHAFGVPFAYWDDGFVDLPFKWHDFAGAIGITSPFVGSVDEGIAAYDRLVKPHQRMLPLSSILTASPFHVRPKVIKAAALLDGARPVAAAPDTSIGQPEASIQGVEADGQSSRRRITRASNVLGMLGTTIDRKIANHPALQEHAKQSAETHATLHSLVDRTSEVAAALQQSYADVGSRLTRLEGSVDRVVSDASLGAALADAQAHSAALEASFKDNTEALRHQTSDVATALQQSHADVGSRLARLETSVDRVVSDASLGAALAEAQAHSAALEASLKDNTEALRHQTSDVTTALRQSHGDVGSRLARLEASVDRVVSDASLGAALADAQAHSAALEASLKDNTEALRHQTNDVTTALQQSHADVGSRLARLEVLVERVVSEVSLGAALAEAQAHSAALEAFLKEDTEARTLLRARVADLEASLLSEKDIRSGIEAAQSKLVAQHKSLVADLAQATDRVGEAEKDLSRVRAEVSSKDVIAGRERASWEKTTDVLRSEAKQMQHQLGMLEQKAEDGRFAASRADELQAQFQALTLQRQEDFYRQARLLDDHARRLHVLNHRADVLTELAAARLRVKSDRNRGTTRGASRHRPLGGSEIASARKRLRDSGLFSPDWYRRHEPEASRLDDAGALKHFLAKGLQAGRDPHPLVSMSWIAGQSEAKGTAPLLAFLETGSRIDPHPLFDSRFYLEINPDLVDYERLPLEHYIAHGSSEGRQPHPAFDDAWYRKSLPADWQQPDHALVHYLTSPDAFPIEPHPLFDGKRYLKDLASREPVNPLLHFVSRGEREGRPPHPLFEPTYYLLRNPDVAANGISPFLHFLRYGAAEHRVTHPLFDPFAYARANGSIPEAVANPLRHYVVTGSKEGLPNGSKVLSPAVLAETMPDLDVASNNPLVAFLDGRHLSLEVAQQRYAPIAPVAPVAPKSSPARVEEKDPEPVETFSLPQRLREYIDERFGVTASGSLRNLMAVVDRFGDRPNSFVVSPSYADLVERMHIAASETVSVPDVSIIIPIHNALAYTLTCIVSILETTFRHSFEIIIGDDASTDATGVTFSDGVGCISVLRHPQNLGFLANCNATAAAARGRHLLFLNNDTLALPEWLDALVDLADRDETIGLIGSKLLNPDGTLQEAGGILWVDGSAWNFGRGDDPNASAFNYVRDVDYCSGASILIPKRVWTELDGFDRHFLPAYCEDSDFAFRARAAGYRTVYQPFSEIVHHEGRSHGRDENKGIKQYQAVNTNKLVARWRTTLERENFRNGEQVMLARDRSRARPHLLVIDHYVPQSDRDAGSRTMYSFLRAFVDRGVHVIFWPDNLYQDPTYTRPLQEMGIEVIYGPSFVGQFERWFSKNSDNIPYVLLSRPHISIKFIDFIKKSSKSTVLYYGHDLHARRLLDEYAVNKSEEAARMAREFAELEMHLWRKSDVTMYPSQTERDIVDGLTNGQVTVLAIPAWTFDRQAIDTAEETVLTDRISHTLLFVGGFTHGPNVDGISWFVSEVMPILQAHDPRFTLTIVGSNAPTSILALSCDTIRIPGFLTDDALATLYEQSNVAIAPLRFGGGVKGKVIEAFSKAIPVVTTPVGVQGISDAETLAFIAETPADFAAAVIEATENHARAARRTAAAADFVRREYTAEKLMNQLTPFMPELAASAAT